MAAQIQGTPIDEGARPYGGLAGMMAGNEFVDRQVANEQAIHQANLENALKEVEARRAQADYSNPQMEQWRQQGIMGKNMSDYSKGKLEYSTLDSNIKTKLAENLSKASAADIDTMINGLDQFTSLASSGNPLAMHQAIGALPPQYQRVVQQLEAQEPGSSVKYAQQLSATIKEARKNSPAHLGKIEEENTRGFNQEIIHQGDRESHERIQSSNNSTQIKLEEMRIAAGKYANKNADRLVLFQKLNPVTQLAKVNAAIIAGADPITGEKLDESGKSYWTMYGQSLGASAELQAPRGEGKIAVPQVANLPGVPTPHVIVPGGSAVNNPPSSTGKKRWDGTKWVNN